MKKSKGVSSDPWPTFLILNIGHDWAGLSTTKLSERSWLASSQLQLEKHKKRKEKKLID